MILGRLASARTKMELLTEGALAGGRRSASKPVFSGNGILDYTCAACASVVCQRMRTGQLKNMQIRCGCCGALNRVP